jgi:neopullulanase
VANTSAKSIEQNVVVETRSQHFTALLGNCPATASAPGTMRISLPAFGYAVCDAR